MSRSGGFCWEVRVNYEVCDEEDVYVHMLCCIIHGTQGRDFTYVNYCARLGWDEKLGRTRGRRTQIV